MQAKPNHAVCDASEKLYRKLTWRIVPYLFVAYVVAFLDRINIGFSQLQMKGDLGFSDAVYGLGAGVFFLGYFFFEVPSNLMLLRIGARRTFVRIMVCWGVVSACMAFVTTPSMLYLMRFLLGAFEAGFFPGIILYLTFWFPASRRAAVTSWLFVAVAIAGVLGGIVSGTIMQYTSGMHGLAGWQWLFIIEGLPAIVLGALALWLLHDSPETATWLTTEEKRFLSRELQEDQEAKREVASASLREALRNPRVYLLAAIYFTLTCTHRAQNGYAFAGVAFAVYRRRRVWSDGRVDAQATRGVAPLCGDTKIKSALADNTAAGRVDRAWAAVIGAVIALAGSAKALAPLHDLRAPDRENRPPVLPGKASACVTCDEITFA